MKRIRWSTEMLQEAANVYGNRTEFARGNPAAYSVAARRKILDDICGHMVAKQAPRYTDDQLRQSAAQFQHRSDWKNTKPSMYQAAFTRGILDDLCAHMTLKPHLGRAPNSPHKWTVEALTAAAAPYTDRAVFRREQPQAADTATRKGVYEQITAHMDRGVTTKLTHDQYVACVPSGITVIGKYISATTKIMHQCNECDNLWSVMPMSIRAGHGCPKCAAKYSGPSKSELELTEFVEQFSDDVQTNTRELITPWEIDIFVPSRNLAIEFNGSYWHSLHPQGYHLNKTLRCEEKGIKLIHVWEHELHNPIMRSIIATALGHSDRVIHARKCTIDQIDWGDAARFLTENHIQGSGAPTPINLGLHHNGELIAVMTFAKPRFKPIHQDWELVRYAVSKNTRVIGGAARLWSKRPIGSVVTYSDRRLFDGALYRRLGFERVNDGAPGYFYVNANGETLSRFQTQRKKLATLLGDAFDPDLSEAENMKRAGWLKIYDCGAVRWVWG